tara:strand:+ start:596 stop:739 length:144 start_codon:yes stop_codon:yes gene_type:complete
MIKIKKKIIYLIHRMGFHNSKCRRRIYATKEDYLCLLTGNSHKKFKI